MADRLDAGFGQGCLQLAVAGNPPGLVAAIPVNGSGARLGNDPGDHLQRIAIRHMEHTTKRVLQGRQGMVKPPAAGRASPVLPRRLVIKDEDRQNITARGGGTECQIVSKA